MRKKARFVTLRKLLEMPLWSVMLSRHFSEHIGNSDQLSKFNEILPGCSEWLRQDTWFGHLNSHQLRCLWSEEKKILLERVTNFE